MDRRPSPFNPHQRSRRQFVEERNEIVGGEMNAAAGRRPAECGFITRAMDVNVPPV
jgi:hypothetical protein